jgi:hypothetical protein
MMTEAVKGHSLGEAMQMSQEFTKMMLGEDYEIEIEQPSPSNLASLIMPFSISNVNLMRSPQVGLFMSTVNFIDL